MRKRREGGQGKIIGKQQSTTAEGQDDHAPNGLPQTRLRKRGTSTRDQWLLPGGSRTLLALRKMLSHLDRPIRWGDRECRPGSFKKLARNVPRQLFSGYFTPIAMPSFRPVQAGQYHAFPCGLQDAR